MSSAGKARRRDSEKASAWVKAHDAEAHDAEAVSSPVTPLEEEGDAIGELLGEAAAPVVRSRFRPSWHQLRWALIIVPILGLTAPLYLWVHYQSQHVTSKNAAVRGNLAEIGTRLSGLVSGVEVDAGDRVKAGQVLVRLEDRHFLAEVQAANAEIAGLRRSIEVERMTIELGGREIEQQNTEASAKVRAAEAQTEAAQIEADDARRAYELRKSLYSRDGAVSSEDVSDAKSVWRAAEARVQEARANVMAAQSVEQGVRLTVDALTIRERKIGVLEADLQHAQARLSRAEADLDGAAIRAPEDGAILRRIIQPGGSVQVGQPIISMWLGDDMWVEAWIDEEDIGQVRLGSKATVTLHSFQGQEFTGVVDKIGLATDLEIPDADVPQPRFARMRGAPVVGVRIRLLEPPEELLPGLSAVVAIEKVE